MIVSVLNGTPHLQVLDSVSVLVLGCALPGDHISAEWRKSKLEHVIGGDGPNDLAHGRVDNGNPVLERNVRFWT